MDMVHQIKNKKQDGIKMVLVYFDNEQKKWFETNVAEAPENYFYLDRGLKNRLDFAKKQQNKDFDAIGLVAGGEGSGKSTLAGNVMRYMTDDEFKPEDIIKDHEDARRILQNIKEGGGIMFDEGYLLFSSTEVMQKAQRDLVKIFSIIRQKRLFCLIVSPSFFRLNSYFALDRSKFLIRVYLGKKGERGFFAYYGDKKKNKLYRAGKKEHDYSVIAPTIRGRFGKCSLLENETYKQVKRETLQASFKIADTKKAKSEYQIRKEFERKLIKSNPEMSSKQLGDLLGLTDRRIRQLRNELD